MTRKRLPRKASDGLIDVARSAAGIADVQTRQTITLLNELLPFVSDERREELRQVLAHTEHRAASIVELRLMIAQVSAALSAGRLGGG